MLIPTGGEVTKMSPRGGSRRGSGRKPGPDPAKKYVLVGLPPYVVAWLDDRQGMASRSVLIEASLRGFFGITREEDHK